MKILGWKPPQRPQWVKEVMKTPGYIKVQLSLLLIDMQLLFVDDVKYLTNMSSSDPLQHNLMPYKNRVM